MNLVGWLVTHPDGKTCVFNAELRNLADVQRYTADWHGTYDELYVKKDIDVALAQAQGQFEAVKYLAGIPAPAKETT